MSIHHTQALDPDSAFSSSTFKVPTDEPHAQLSGSPIVVVKEGATSHLRDGQLKASQVSSRSEKSLLLSIERTAECLEIAPKTIRKWLSNGTCPFPTVLLGARRLVRRVDLEKFVNELGCAQSSMLGTEPLNRQELKRGRGRPRKTLTPAAQGGAK